MVGAQFRLLSTPAFLKFKAVYGWELLEYQELAEGVKAAPGLAFQPLKEILKGK
ncbi:hypothetical protein NYE33_26040 [Paenibacillus sp. FSL R10-2199]|uniref:hypothetical protein n=1 Tax=Paenibacillus sp. FSL R10-2199 TaxID=2975348 RepID=UPI0030FB747F